MFTKGFSYNTGNIDDVENGSGRCKIYRERMGEFLSSFSAAKNFLIFVKRNILDSILRLFFFSSSLLA